MQNSKINWLKLAMFAVLVIVSSSSKSQSKTSPGTFGGEGNLGIRFQHYDFKNLNASFKSSGLPEITENIVSFSGGGLAYIDHLIIGGNGASYQLLDKDNGTYKTTVSGGVGFFNVGYMVINKSNFMLYPILGIGGSTMRIEIYENNKVDFAQLLSNPKKGTIIQNEQFVLDLGLQSNLFLAKQKTFGIGLKLGYQIAPTESKWSDSNGTITNGPVTNADGLYTQLQFCFGGFTK